MGGGTHVLWPACGSQRITAWSWFSPSAFLCIPGMEFMLSVCVTTSFTNRAILSAHFSF